MCSAINPGADDDTNQGSLSVPLLNKIVLLLLLLLPILADLPGVRAADLSSNYLTQLPPTLSTLTSLAALRLSSNSLQDSGIPWASLASLGPSLTSLLLDENQLSTLPKELGSLSRLVRLSVGCNVLEHVEIGALGSLSALQSLQLNNNKLATLPEDIGGSGYEAGVIVLEWAIRTADRLDSGLGD